MLQQRLQRLPNFLGSAFEKCRTHEMAKMTDKRLHQRDAKRDLGDELLQTIREMKAGEAARVHLIMKGTSPHGLITHPQIPDFAKRSHQGENGSMAKAKKRALKKRPALKHIVMVGAGFALVAVRKKKATAQPRESERAFVLVRKVGRALQTPGISRNVIFPKDVPKRLYTYSVDPEDPSRILRKARNGSRSTGRLVGGRFRAD
jgi:hypothetical protein